MKLKVGDTATIVLGQANTPCSYKIDSIESDTVLLSHPFLRGLLLRYPSDQLDKMSPPIMSSTERGLFFVLQKHGAYLNYYDHQSILALATHFALERKLTSDQLRVLSTVLGQIAKIELSGSLNVAMKLLLDNEVLLDEFNTTWFNIFKPYLTKAKPVYKENHRTAIFNMAGFVLAEVARVSVVLEGTPDGK